MEARKMARTKQTARKSTGGRAHAGSLRPQSDGRADKRSYTAPSGQIGADVKGTFVVVSRQYYEPDGFHSYQGPGESKVNSKHRSRNAAFKAARKLFWIDNPWGLEPHELEDTVEEDYEDDHRLKLAAHPEDSDVWEVEVKMVKESKQNPRKAEKAENGVGRAEKKGKRVNAIMSASTASKRAKTLPHRDCPCGAGPCNVLTSNSKANPGRQYFKCPMPRGQQCKFFQWLDQAALGNSSSTG